MRNAQWQAMIGWKLLDFLKVILFCPSQGFLAGMTTHLAFHRFKISNSKRGSKGRENSYKSFGVGKFD